MIEEIKKAANYTARTVRTMYSESTGGRPRLENLVYEITDGCNSRCVHCSIWQTKTSPDILRGDEIERIFESGCFRHVKNFLITGGEPALRPDLTENLLTIQKYIHPEACVTLSTNGLMPERTLKTVTACLESGMNLVVGVSLDGIGHKHDRIRGIEGNFEKVDGLFRALSELKQEATHKGRLSITVGFTFSPETAEYLEEVGAYANSIGLEFLPQVYEEFTYYSNVGQIKNKSNETLVKVLQALPTSFQKEILLRAANDEPIKYRCSSLKNFFVLRCNGDISPCLRYANIRLGSLRHNSLDDLLESKEMKEALSMVKRCDGCSNSWATAWSKQYWMPPFFRIMAGVTLKKGIEQFKGGTQARRH